MENILNINLKKLNDLNGGGIYNEIIYLNNNKIELEISENEFKYKFDLYVDENLEFSDQIFFENFEFEYLNQNNDNISNIVYKNIYNKLNDKINEYLNETINEIDKIINSILL